MIKTVRTFSVSPALPEAIKPIRDLAYNLWWTWHQDAVDLFRRLDPDLWERSEHNPVYMLGQIDQSRLDAAAADQGFKAQLNNVVRSMNEYMASDRWHQLFNDWPEDKTIAYFSAEFGINESLPIYSGGLGVLAGDHLKSASDLGLPLVGMGLLYREGYFRQYLNADGWQQESYPELDFHTLPVEQIRDEDGMPLTISVECGDHKVFASIWKAQVGRIPLYLLDANVPGNRPADRIITDRLYGGDQEMRVRQEVLLGIGGITALHALGINPTVCHMNEGHSAFLALERIRLVMQNEGLSFEEAREATASGNVFTTHTPVPAGNDAFPPQLMDKYFSHYFPTLGLSHRDFLGLGRRNIEDDSEPFNMTILALKLASHSNGVSKLHGQVSRSMWQSVWPEVPETEIPIDHITNGIHTQSWISRDMATLLDRYLGPGWIEDPADKRIWQAVDQIPDAELWRTHERRRERLVAFTRHALREQLRRRYVPASELDRAEEVLDPEALTIGFARRFATYKRGALLLRDIDRLKRILADPERPVQIIFAGKAHPRDAAGKDIIRQIVHLARDEVLRRHIVFVEDYNINVARYMVEGVDVWMNTPRRPMEASGTSGMKVPPNGGLNLSILDGWWCEGYRGNNGWVIGSGEQYEDADYQDQVESQSIYDLLEKEIVNLYYDRGPDDLPRGWIARMKESMKTICPVFNMHRTVREYAERFYTPSAKRTVTLWNGTKTEAIKLARWKQEIRDSWNNIRVESIDEVNPRDLFVGNELDIRATINLGSIAPESVAVELYAGPVDSNGHIRSAQTVPMTCTQSAGNGQHIYSGSLACNASGQFGYAVRILPHHPHMPNQYEPGLILWS